VDTPLGKVEPSFVALFGVLVGTIATFIAGRIQRERDDRIRLTPEKIAASSEIIAKVDAILFPFRRVYADRTIVPDPFDFDDVLTTFAKAELVAGPLTRGLPLLIRSSLRPQTPHS
jgi:hypothetical protein